ncbi:hypothetical protein [Dactylosporangium sp. NPDC049140]|uniref:hypothetical protein n=1 Tax=Dactylosporangium sp. NPDC049140 TaxID=3155647 RepID=UPI0033E73D0C
MLRLTTTRGRPLPRGQLEQRPDAGQVGPAEELAGHGVPGGPAQLGAGDAGMAQGHADRAAGQAEGGPDVGGAQPEHVARKPAAGDDHVMPGVPAGRRERHQRQQVPLQRRGDEHDAHGSS